MSSNFSYTPILATKRFKKLRLKRRSVNSCSPKQRNWVKKHNNEHGVYKREECKEETHERAPSPFYTNQEFDSPPFVTKSRPKYSKNSSTSQLSDDFISNTSTSEIKSQTNFKYDESFIMNSVDAKTHRCEHNSMLSREKEDKIERSDNEEKSNQYSTPKHNIVQLLSPKSAIIMTKLYGDIWQKTPGLFKKTKVSNELHFDNDCNLLTNQLDLMNLNIDHRNELPTNNSENNDLMLKPQRLFFEKEDGMKQTHINTSINPKFDKSIPKGDLNSDSDDSIFSTKRIRKKKIFSSSSSSDSNDGPESKKYVIISDSDNENKESDEEKKFTKRSIFRVEENLDCSLLLIKTDTDILNDKENKAIDKKTRKLFNKCNTTYNEVQFVSEQSPNEIIKQNRVYEIIDDGVPKELDKSVFSSYLPRECIKETELKSKKDLETKKVKRKPRRERKRCKENIPPSLLTHNIKLDDQQVYGFMASLSDSIPSSRCNKEAKYFKDNFKSKKSELTQKLFVLFNDRVYSQQLAANLPITWSATLQTTAGRAVNKLKRSKTSSGNVRDSTVELSLKVVDTAQRLRDTLAHELCHVASFIIDGQLRDGHGPCWKKWVAKTLKVFPELGSIPVCHSLTIHYKYTFKCTKCGYGVNRHSKSIDIKRKVCGYCGGRFECIHNKKNKDGLVVSTPVKQSTRELKGFALYVKENYGNVRGCNTPHKQAMQYLGKQFAKMKATKSCSDTDQ